MHEPAGVGEVLVQILQFTPILNLVQNTPLPHENCQSPNPSFRIPPQIKLFESPSPRVSEYPPKMKIVTESKSESFRIPPKLKLSQSPNLRVSEYPPKIKIVTESKSESFRIPPQNENCHRVQIREFQYTPPKMKIVTESKSESFRIPPPPQNRKNFRFQTSE